MFDKTDALENATCDIKRAIAAFTSLVSGSHNAAEVYIGVCQVTVRKFFADSELDKRYSINLPAKVIANQSAIANGHRASMILPDALTAKRLCKHFHAVQQLNSVRTSHA